MEDTSITRRPRRARRARRQANTALRPVRHAVALASLAIVSVSAPAWAAPIYGPANLEQGASSCFDDTPAVAQGVNAQVVNSGRGLVLSGKGSVAGSGDLCVQLTWRGTMTGNIDSPNNIPVAWDFTVGYEGPAGAEVASSIFVQFDHDPYLVGTINQGGYGIYETFGSGHVVSAPDLAIGWPSPIDHEPRSFLAYSVKVQASVFADPGSVGTLTLDVPARSSVDLGDVQRTSVPAADMGALLALGIAAMVRLRRYRG